MGESEKETARWSRSLSTSQKARIKSEKKTSCIDRGRLRVKKLRTGLGVLGGFVISSKKGKKRQN